ncbi:MAG: hypothetical protein AAFQ22_07240, partial [Pseudomonadota bacterium]
TASPRRRAFRHQTPSTGERSMTRELATKSESQKPQYITIRMICGHLAMWVVRQHPYGLADGVDEVNKILMQTAEDLEDWDHFAGMTGKEFSDFWEIFNWVDDVLKDHPQLKRWNAPKSGHSAEFVVRSRFGAPKPEDDFIDIDALFRNAALGAWREAEAMA